MLTRLKVNGFKNLVDIDVRFGPFTCIAGANGVGKSNLFDAIMFLSALAEKPLLDAAKSVRDDEGRSSDIHSLFHRVGNTYDNEMTFEAEMIVPEKGFDDLGQSAGGSIRKFSRNSGRSTAGRLSYRWHDNWKRNTVEAEIAPTENGICGKPAEKWVAFCQKN